MVPDVLRADCPTSSSGSRGPTPNSSCRKYRGKGKTPGSGRPFRKTPSPCKSSSNYNAKQLVAGSPKIMKEKEEPENNADMAFTEEKSEESFTDHSQLCERMAKTLYFANKLPSTPRPSLPLTMLAVKTFASAARKDTLEFLDLEMAAEIGRNACVSPTALIMALVYLERLSSHNPGYLNSTKPSELFVISLLVASKFIRDDGEDLGIFNDEWAASAQMDLKKLNQLELQFLSAIDWRVNVKQDDYDRVLKTLENKLALDQGMRRGWFTYTEVGKLTNTLLAWDSVWPILFEYCIQALTAACATYTFIATVLASSVLIPQLFFKSKALLTTSSVLVAQVCLMSKALMTPNMDTLCNVTGQSEHCSKNENVSVDGISSIQFNAYHQRLQDVFPNFVAAEDMIVSTEENEINSMSTGFHKNLDQVFKYQITDTDATWKTPMNAKTRLELGLVNSHKNISANKICHQDWKRISSTWNEEAFTRYLKHFLISNGRGDFRSEETEDDIVNDLIVNMDVNHGLYQGIETLKKRRLFGKRGLPFYSVQKV